MFFFFYYNHYYDYGNNFLCYSIYTYIYVFYIHLRRLTWLIIEGKYGGGDYSKTFQSEKADKKTIPVNTKTTSQ